MSVFYIFFVLSNARPVLSQCNVTLKLFHLLIITTTGFYKTDLGNFNLSFPHAHLDEGKMNHIIMLEIQYTHQTIKETSNTYV